MAVSYTHLDVYKRQEEAYAQPASTDDYATDCLWYLWCGEGLSLIHIFSKMIASY